MATPTEHQGSRTVAPSFRDNGGCRLLRDLGNIDLAPSGAEQPARHVGVGAKRSLDGTVQWRRATDPRLGSDRYDCSCSRWLRPRKGKRRGEAGLSRRRAVRSYKHPKIIRH